MPGPFNLFLSYGRKDDELFVKRLYDDLLEGGFRPWYDHAGSLESNGLSFLLNIRNALLDNPLRVIYVSGPHAAESEYVKAEIEFAMENCLVVIPILRIQHDDYELLPEALRKRRLHCYDFRRDEHYEANFRILSENLAKGVKPLGRQYGVINKPANYILRDDLLNSIKGSLLKDAVRATVITSIGKATALQGMGGIGKSVIACAVCHDCDVRRAFEDGIYWITVGQNPDVQRILQYLLKDESIDINTHLGEARDKLALFLRAKKCLIVLDDVWEKEHIELFSSDFALACRLLVTTRNKQTVKYLSGNIVEIGLLKELPAKVLLAKTTDRNILNLPPAADKIIKECGYLPLAICMIGGMLKFGDENAWDHALKMLESADLAAIAQKFPNYPYPNLFKAIDVSIQSLDKPDREKYLQLGIFKGNTRIPEEVIHQLWKSEGWEDYHTHWLLNKFAEMNVLQRIDTAIYGLHDLLFDYIRKTNHKLKAAHRKLIKDLPDPLKSATRYAHDNYIWHLSEAGSREKAIKLIQSFAWMEARMYAGNINDLIKDYEQFPLDTATVLIYKALKLSKNVLLRDKGQLSSQLEGRLKYFDDQPVRELLLSARDESTSSGLRPIKTHLTPPGNLINILKGHYSTIVRIIGEGDQLISVSEDHLIKVWNLDTGKCVHTLEGHLGLITEIRVDGHHIITGSDDATIRVWDITDGSATCALKQHRDSISALLVTKDRIYSGSMDKTIIAWDRKTGRVLHQLTGHTDTITQIMAYGDKIISGSDFNDRSVRVWDVNNGRCLAVLGGSKGSIDHLLVCKGKILASSEFVGRSIHAWDLQTYKPLFALSAHQKGIIAARIHRDRLFSGSYDNSICVIDPDAGLVEKRLTGHTQNIRELEFYGEYVISQSDDYSIRVWDIGSGACRHVLVRHKQLINRMLIKDSKLFSCSKDEICVWDLGSGELLHAIGGHFEKDLLMINQSLISHSGYNINIWDYDSKITQRADFEHTGEITQMEIHGECVVTGSDDCSIRVWERATGKCKWTLVGHFGGITSLKCENGKIVSGSNDGTVRIWDINSGTCDHVLEGHKGSVTSLIVADSRIVSASWYIDPAIRVWHLERGTAIAVFEETGGPIKGLLDWWGSKIGFLGHVDREFPPLYVNANNLLRYSVDGVIEVWDLGDKKCLQMIKAGQGLKAVLVRDKRIICSKEGGIITIWPLLEGHWQRSMKCSGEIIFVDRCENLLIVGTVGNIEIWDISAWQKVKNRTSALQITCVCLAADRKIIFCDQGGGVTILSLDLELIAKYSFDTSFGVSIVAGKGTLVVGDRLNQVHIFEIG